MLRPLSRRHLASGGLLAGLALTGTALSLGASHHSLAGSLSASAEPTAHSQAVVAPSPIAAPARPRHASRGLTRTSLHYVRKDVAVGRAFSGEASWYGGSFQGRRTASGERFNTYALTAASRTLPFGTRVRVCRHSRCVVVRINDRGPYVGGRVLDLSKAARDRLGSFGVARVTATPVDSRRVPVRRTVGVKGPAPRTPAPIATLQPRLVAQSTPAPVPAATDGLLASGLLLTSASGLLWLRGRRVGS